MKKIFVTLSIVFVATFMFAQNKQDKAEFRTYKNEFYNSIKESFGEKPGDGRKVFKMKTDGEGFPKSEKEFTTVWCSEPVSQGRTGTCWDFSTTSFFEAEIFRLTKQKIKLSEMYITYWEYLSKADEYVKTKGKSNLGEGSEANAVTRQIRKHGLMPYKAFPGKVDKYLDHKRLFAEFKATLEVYKAKKDLDNPQLYTDLKVVLDKYIGTPPTSFRWKGKTYEPSQFAKSVAKINPNNYIEVLSLKEMPYWKQVEYIVPDNYWHSDEYYNVPLDNFMDILKNAVKNGYSVSIGGDVSEPGYLPEYDVAVVPTFDIPSEYITEDARQLRFSNRSTTDDHGIHLVGYKIDKDGTWWFLIKDSGSSSRNGNSKGYSFYREDYIKLKMMNYTIHKDAVGDEFFKKF